MKFEQNTEYEVIKITLENKYEEVIVDEIICELNIPIVSERWTSKYNEYISYSCKPNIADDYRHSVSIPLTNRGAFAMFLLEKYSNFVTIFESLLDSGEAVVKQC